MRPVVQASAWWRPHDSGGTEVYLEGLVDELGRLGVACEALTPRADAAPAAYEHRGVPVETYPVGPARRGREWEDEPPHLGFEAFRAALQRRKGAIYHQHAWTRGCGPKHLGAARELGFRTVLTAHVPGVVCLRGTMLRDGVEPCEGPVSAEICAACWATGRGSPPGLARALGRLPPALSRAAGRVPGRLGTAMAARALAQAALRRIVDMSRDADRVVAVCGWMREALRRGGVPEGKLALSRQGLARDLIFAETPPPAGPLRLKLLARCDAVKGIDTAVLAVRALPLCDVALDIHALPQPGEAAAYARKLRDLAGDDPRICFAPPIARADLPAALASADALLVPSRWLETGPLTVLEAQAAGLYVIGANRGGVAELLADDPCAELVAVEDVAAWTAAIASAAQRKAQGRLPRGRRPVRGMAEAAADMAAIYRSLG